MKLKVLLALPILATCLHLVPLHAEGEEDGSDVQRDLLEREEKIGKLSVDEQLKLRAAQVKATDDPDVKAALEKRNEAVREFRAAFRAAVLKADPKLTPVLDRIAIGDQPGF